MGIPNYFKIIKEPMDLETIEQNLKNDYYESEKEVKEDLNKIWNNALLFNPENTMINWMAKEMLKYCHQLFKSKEEVEKKGQKKITVEGNSLKDDFYKLSPKD